MMATRLPERPYLSDMLVQTALDVAQDGHFGTEVLGGLERRQCR